MALLVPIRIRLVQNLRQSRILLADLENFIQRVVYHRDLLIKVDRAVLIFKFDI